MTVGTVRSAASDDTRASAFTPEFQVLAWILLVASTPAIVCAICSAFLAYKERRQWVWFAALAVLAEIGGVVMLRAADVHWLARAA